MEPNQHKDTRSPSVDRRQTDGGDATGFDEVALYSVVRHAVRDALLDVLGTVVLVGVAFVLVIAGSQALVSAVSLRTVAIGFGAIAVGLYLAATNLGILPPISDWR